VGVDRDVVKDMAGIKSNHCFVTAGGFIIANEENGASNIFHAHKATCCCGNEDWFGIGHTEVMDKYLDRLLYLPYRDLQGWGLQPGWTAEQYLEAFLRLYACAQLTDEPKIQACIVKPSDRRQPGDP